MNDYSPQYIDSLEVIAPGITAEIQNEQQGGESWIDSLSRLLPILATTYQQRQLLEIQVDRARQGLPPLDASAYAPGVRVGLASDTGRALAIAGAVLGGIVLLAVMRR